MKTITFDRCRRHGFTLIELLVVITIIGILAGLILAIAPGISVKRKVSVAYSELRSIETAIEAYKAHYGFYPPDNPNPDLGRPSPLYYELVGSTNNGLVYRTLDGQTNTLGNFLSLTYGVTAFVNSSTSLKGTDDKPGPVSFLKELRRVQTPLVPVSTSIGTLWVSVLASSEEYGLTGSTNSSIAQWHYTTSHAVNNPGSYDLFVDLYYKGNTYRISNWRKTPFVR